MIEPSQIRTVAFPSISTGAYRFPIERASRIAVSQTKRFLAENTSLQQVRFVCFGKAAYGCYVEAVAEVMGRRARTVLIRSDIVEPR